MNQNEPRPEICLGYEPIHATPGLVAAFSNAFVASGLEIGHNTPFAGSYVPKRYFQKDARVQSIMLEIRKDQYLTGNLTAPTINYSAADKIASTIAKVIVPSLL